MNFIVLGPYHYSAIRIEPENEMWDFFSGESEIGDYFWWKEGTPHLLQGVPRVGKPSPGVPGVRKPSPGVPGVGKPSPGVPGVGKPSPGVPGVGKPSPGVLASLE